MSYGHNRDSGSPSHLALSTSIGASTGAEEESNLRTTARNGGESQEAAAPQSGILSGVAGHQPRSAKQYPAVVETQPRDDRSLTANRIGFSQFSESGSVAGGEGEATQDHAGRGSHYGADR